MDGITSPPCQPPNDDELAVRVRHSLKDDDDDDNDDILNLRREVNATNFAGVFKIFTSRLFSSRLDSSSLLRISIERPPPIAISQDYVLLAVAVHVPFPPIVVLNNDPLAPVQVVT